jgi:hypothetical protein
LLQNEKCEAKGCKNLIWKQNKNVMQNKDFFCFKVKKFFLPFALKQNNSSQSEIKNLMQSKPKEVKNCQIFA